MLDVIVTVSDSTPRPYVRECLATVKVAASIAGYPVQVHQVPGYPGHIGKAMANALVQCSNPWVAWVDDDDFVLPNAFSCLRRHMDGNWDAIAAREIQLLANGTWAPQNRRHHLTAFRRSAILCVDLSLYPSFPNVALHNATPNAAQEESWVYVYRRRRSPASYLRGSATAAEREVL